MRTVLRSGTDAGTMALFDPKALPSGLEPLAFANTDWKPIQQDGRLCLIETWSDGEYELVVTSGDLKPVEREFGILRSTVRLEVPSGELHFRGIEWLYQTRRRNHPARSEEVMHLESGVYRAEVFEIDTPEDWQDQRLVVWIGDADYQAYLRGSNRGCLLGSLGVLCLIAFAVTLVFHATIATVISIIGLLASVLWLRHKRDFQAFSAEVEERMKAIKFEFPGWIVRLTKLS